jgi:hypothetical protein
LLSVVVMHLLYPTMDFGPTPTKGLREGSILKMELEKKSKFVYFVKLLCSRDAYKVHGGI